MSATDLRIDVREAVTQCVYWMEAVKLALETIKARSEDRKARIDLNALGKFIDEADSALRDLDTLIDNLIDGDIPLETDATAKALAFYADERSYRAPRGQVSPITKDGGYLARVALTTLTDEAGDDDGEGK